MLSFQVPAGAGSADRAGPSVAKNRRADSIQMVRGMTRFLGAYREGTRKRHAGDGITLSAIGLRLKGIGRAGFAAAPESLRHFARGANATPLAFRHRIPLALRSKSPLA